MKTNTTIEDNLSKQTATPPTFFRACIAEARSGGAGYAEAGFQLSLHLSDYLSSDYSENEVDAALSSLSALLIATNNDRALAWFDEEFPKLMRLVPRRRRYQFLNGVYRALDEDRIE